MAFSDVGGRVTDGADSPAAVGSSDRAKALALKMLPGWRRLRLQTWVALATANGQALWVGGRREEAKGGTRRRRAAFARCIWDGHWVRCGRGGLVFLALARSAAARRLGDSAARRLVGSPAQWKRPRNRSHVAARDRTTKPSWGLDAQAGLVRLPAFLPMEVSVKQNIPKKARLRPGVCAVHGGVAAERRDDEEATSAPHSRRLKKNREAAWCKYRNSVPVEMCGDFTPESTGSPVDRANDGGGALRYQGATRGGRGVSIGGVWLLSPRVRCDCSRRACWG